MRIEKSESTTLCYMRVDGLGWFTASPTYAELKDLVGGYDVEIVCPIFPKVYTPVVTDKPYYDAILNSDMKKGDKVLVVGCGSGSDTWVAWLKTKRRIYNLDINRQAILNTYSTARLGGFEVEQCLGDIRDIELPEDFKGFDFVLWNMPYLDGLVLEKEGYYDADDGTAAKAFIKLLPSLLKKKGKAIIINTVGMEKYINLPITRKESNDEVAVYTIELNNG